MLVANRLVWRPAKTRLPHQDLARLRLTMRLLSRMAPRLTAQRPPAHFAGSIAGRGTRTFIRPQRSAAPASLALGPVREASRLGVARRLVATPHRGLCSTGEPREAMEYDVVIVGAGPAGLAAAIRIKQLGAESGKDLSVVVVEKAAEVGLHILSGNVFETKALDELIPDWKEKGAPLDTPAGKDVFVIMTGETGGIEIPNWLLPKTLDNHGNYIISLGQLVRWLAEQAVGAPSASSGCQNQPRAKAAVARPLFSSALRYGRRGHVCIALSCTSCMGSRRLDATICAPQMLVRASGRSPALGVAGSRLGAKAATPERLCAGPGAVSHQPHPQTRGSHSAPPPPGRLTPKPHRSRCQSPQYPAHRPTSTLAQGDGALLRDRKFPPFVRSGPPAFAQLSNKRPSLSLPPSPLRRALVRPCRGQACGIVRKAERLHRVFEGFAAAVAGLREYIADGEKEEAMGGSSRRLRVCRVTLRGFFFSCPASAAADKLSDKESVPALLEGLQADAWRVFWGVAPVLRPQVRHD
jgi:hypothetical protein